MVMALAVMTWAGWSPAIASGDAYDTAVEETGNQDEAANEENFEDELNYQEIPGDETQEEAPDTN